MIRILVTDGMESSGIDELRKSGFEVVEKFYSPEELGDALKDFNCVVVRSATKVREPIIDKALEGGNLKLIIRGGVGVDNIDVKYAESKGISVRNTPNASSASVAELAIGHMFAAARFIGVANATMREGKWDKKKYEGFELGGKTLGLIGFGRIAKETAKRAEALGMKVIYTKRSGKEAEYDNYEYCDKEELLKKSDFISLHIPYDKVNGPTIGEKEFELMKDGVYLINLARGGIVCEKALLDALNSGKVRGAGIDVFKEEPTKNMDIVNHPRVSVTPHIGGSTIEAQTRIGEEIVFIIKETFK
ncbi:D-2-hydroxyacid dehydrogenase [Clostridium hydrogeniformans]|uniref:D-2-hydroxyacid dehydrogenase n=1 Tax=Clostridium hydrogeniformans TaxID=349933 RepID=UPI00048145CC|nr:D-2-hydroxyacid dehydrogenase [Clostridium hydrogeniformans]